MGRRSFATKLSGLISVARERGLGGALRQVGYRLNEEFHERRFGIRTAGLVSESELGHDSSDFLSYSGAPYRALWYCLNRISIRPGEDSLLDIGSGMGRALIVAASKPFRRVVGVEISPRMAERARENLAQARKHLKCEVRLEVADATSYQIPDDISVIHLFNPFVGATLARVGANIRALLERRGKLTLMYGNPGHFEAMFMGEGWLQPRWSRSFYPGIDYAVYDCRRAESP